MRRHQVVIFAVLLVSAWAALALAAPRTEQQFGLLFTRGPEAVVIGKSHRVEAPPTAPAQTEDCLTHNWASCNAACGGIAFSCSREATYFYAGCAPLCQWVVHVTITCGC